MSRRFWAALGLALLSLLALPIGGRLGADDEYQKIIYIRVGDPAPEFEAVDDKGNKWRSRQYVGKKIVVVYFYMGDFMLQDIKQARAYEKDLRRLTGEGAIVVGVSGDSQANHKLFKEALGLNYTLLADPAGKVVEVFGVHVSGGGDFEVKDTEGKPITIARGCTPNRTTFVIGRDGKVLYKNVAVKATDDCREVLAAIVKHNAKRK